MKTPQLVLRVGPLLATLLVFVWQIAVPLNALAGDTPQPLPQLNFRQVSITGENEFIVLQNNGLSPVDLSHFWLGYTGSDNSTAAPTQNLSAQTLAPGAAVVLSKDAAPLCGAEAFDSLSFSLANTSGTLALWQLSDSGGSMSFGLSTSISWGKLAPTSEIYLNMTDENAVKNYKKDASVVWYNQQSSLGGEWQAGFTEDCNFTPVISSTSMGSVQTIDWQTDDSSPPFSVAAAIIIGNKPTASIPAADIGLKPPKISEILPNPATPKTDAKDEFIELYNPNGKTFDLSGFSLRIGSTTSSATHNYTLPAGTTIAPKSFRAFYSAQTHLGLNNSGGKVWLLDPLGTVIGESGIYDKAEDGLSWIDAAGKWQWTGITSPGKANQLAAVVDNTGKKVATIKGSTLSNVKGAATASNTGSAASPTSGLASVDKAEVHPWVLAAVALVALLYGAYEYRVDLSNRLYQFRRYRKNRR